MELRKRFYKHRSGIKNGKGGCPIITAHFNQGCNNYKIKIVELISLSGDMEKDDITRRNRETYWIKELRTKFPYGMNDKLPGEDSQIPIGVQLNRRNHINRKRGKKRPRRMRNAFIHAHLWIMEKHRLFALDKSKTLKNTLSEVSSMPLHNIKHLLTEIITRNNTVLDELIKDICCSRIYKPNTIAANTKRSNRPKIKIQYNSKNMNNIYLNKIFSNKNILETWPSTIDNKYANPMPIYKYMPPISSKIFNYRQTITDIDLDEWINKPYSCNCNNSPFKDIHHGHIITGDMNFVNHNNLKKILNMGTKFRLSKKETMSKTKKNLIYDIAVYLNNITDKSNRPFDEWIKLVIEDINKSQITHYKNNHIRWNDSTKDFLNNFQKSYVITTVDKANQNYSIICKEFYIQQLLKEVGYPNNTSPTYEYINDTTENVITNTIISAEQFAIKITDKNKQLPFIQIIPKFHKTPIGFRTIVASASCSTKQLSKTIGQILKKLQIKLMQYCNTIKNATKTNPFWIISSNKLLLEQINNLSHTHNIHNINTFDFEQLYTNINHNLLQEALETITKIAFGSSKRHITANERFAYWCMTKYKDNSYDLITTNNMIHTLINNSYFSMGNKCFRQMIGIPMGTDCAPFLANLFLFKYEYTYIMEKLKAKEYETLTHLKYVYRYIDDITTINDKDNFKNIFPQIYPNCLTLKQVNTDNKNADILDININIHDKQADTITFDKRTLFSFNTIIFPHMDSNIHKNIHTNTIKEQIKRHAYICSNTNNFTQTITQVFRKTKSRGYSKQLLMRCFIKTYNKANLHRKFGDLNTVVSNINL